MLECLQIPVYEYTSLKIRSNNSTIETSKQNNYISKETNDRPAYFWHRTRHPHPLQAAGREGCIAHINEINNDRVLKEARLVDSKKRQSGNC